MVEVGRCQGGEQLKKGKYGLMEQLCFQIGLVIWSILEVFSRGLVSKNYVGKVIL